MWHIFPPLTIEQHHYAAVLDLQIDRVFTSQLGPFLRKSLEVFLSCIDIKRLVVLKAL